MSSVTLHFPAKSEIVSYLEQHPLISKETKPCSTEKKVIETVAGFFANRDVAPMGVDMGVALTMIDLNDELKLPEGAFKAISLNLTAALKDCGAGKALSVEKKTAE